MATVTLRLTPQRAHVRTARLVAAAMARRSGVPEEFLDEVRLAVGEACGRAVQLHERYGLTEPVVVTLADDDDRFKVVVRDLAPSKPGSDAAVGKPGGGSTVTGPIAVDIPHRPTICRAMLLTWSRSLSAPVVMSPYTTSSAARPPSAPVMRSRRYSEEYPYRSVDGAWKVTPSAWPRGMIEIFRTGSAPGVSMPTSAWPASW